MGLLNGMYENKAKKDKRDNTTQIQIMQAEVICAIKEAGLDIKPKEFILYL